MIAGCRSSRATRAAAGASRVVVRGWQVVPQVEHSLRQAHQFQIGEAAGIGRAAREPHQGDVRRPQQAVHRRRRARHHEECGVDPPGEQRLGGLVPAQRPLVRLARRDAVGGKEGARHRARAAALGADREAAARQVGKARNPGPLACEQPDRLEEHAGKRDQPGVVVGPRDATLHERDVDTVLVAVQQRQVLDRAARRHHLEPHPVARQDAAVGGGEGGIGAVRRAGRHAHDVRRRGRDELVGDDESGEGEKRRRQIDLQRLAHGASAAAARDGRAPPPRPPRRPSPVRSAAPARRSPPPGRDGPARPSTARRRPRTP